MPRVLVNGQPVDFATMPSEADIDEAAKNLGPPPLAAASGFHPGQLEHDIASVDPQIGTTLATTAMRAVPPIVGGAVAGLPGALAGGAAGSLLAQEYEKAAGLRDGISVPRLAVDTAVSGIPALPTLGLAGKVPFLSPTVANTILRSLQGGATAGVTGAVTNVSEGIPWDAGLVRNVTLGAGVGGVAGLTEAMRGHAVTAKAVERAQASDVTLYRGEGTRDGQSIWQDPAMADFTGRWFTTNRAKAEQYAQHNGGPNARVLAVRVPGDVADSARVAGTPVEPYAFGDITDTRLLPPEWAARAQSAENVPLPPVTAASPEQGPGTPAGAPGLPAELGAAQASTAAQGEATQAFKADAGATARALAETDASKQGQRLYLRIAEAFEKGKPGTDTVDFEGVTLHVPSIMKALNQDGLSPADFAVHLRQTVQSQGRGLQFLSQVQKSLNDAAKNDKALRGVLDSLSDAPQPTWLGRVASGFRKMDDVRRSLLVTQISTTARNVESQGATTLVGAVDEATSAVLQGQGLQAGAAAGGRFGPGAVRSAGESLADVLQFLRIKSPQSLRTVSKVLEKFPDQAEELIGTPAAEGALGKVSRVLNTFNTFQERFYRRANFDALLRNKLASEGIDVHTALANPQTIPPDIVQGAVDQSLKLTFAANPEGKVGKAVMDAFSNPVVRPLFTTVNPFPRFMVNAYGFLLDHSPAGYLRLMGVTNDQRLLTDPKYAQGILAKAHVGTTLLAGALALRNSDAAGEKWYQVNVGGKSVDARPYAPFSTFLFYAELMKQMAQNGGDIHNVRMTTNDVMQGLVSINRIAGTGLVAVDLLRAGAMDRKMSLLGDVISQYLGGFTVPFNTLKDVMAQSDPNEAVMRDTKTDKYTTDVLGVPISAAPMMRNVPGLDTLLPETRSPLRSGPLVNEAPMFRQFTGISARTKNAPEKEVDRLAIESARILPSSGVPEYDRLRAEAMGPVVEQVLPQVTGSPAYLKLKPSTQRLVVDQLLGQIRKQASKGVALQRPDLATKVRLKGLDADIKDILEEQGIPLP